jgi:L-iditol 2-dehydrogenase
MGAARTLNPNDCDVTAAVRDGTGGRGADVTFEVVGHGDTVLSAIRSLRKGGTAVLVGNLSPAVSLPLQEVVSREISVLGSCASSGEIPECIDLLARGVVDVDPIISLKASLDDGPGLFERLYEGDRSLMKVILQP